MPAGNIARFGTFELDLDGGELSRRGRPLTLQDQQMLVLKYLVQHAGTVVTREELQAVIWPEGTFVEFEVGLYNTINRLRRALGDTASNSHFIETVPKLGYRFIAAVDYKTSNEATGTPLAPAVEIPDASDPPQVRLRFYSIIASFVLVGVGVAAGIFLAPRFRTPAPGQVYKFSILLPGFEEVGAPAISPAGDQIVFQGPEHMLYRRYLDQPAPRAIAGTQGGRSPFFSPDGQGLGFFTEHELKILENERIRSLAVLPSNYQFWDACWGEDGFVYFNNAAGDIEGIWRIPAKGGKSELVVRETLTGHGAQVPFVNQILVHPRHVMFYAVNSGPLRRSLHVRDLDTGREQLLLDHGIGGHVIGQHLIYFERGSLFAISFDAKTLTTRGAAVEMVKDVATYYWQAGRASVSNTGSLVYVTRPEPVMKRLQWLDAAGKITPLTLQDDPYQQAAVSPKGDRLAIVRQDQPYQFSLWTYDLHSGAWRHILDSQVPVPRVQWSPDESALVVGSEKQNQDFLNLYRLPLDDPQNLQRLAEEPNYGQFPLSWSAKANAILFVEGVHEVTNSDIMILPLGANRHAKKLIASPGWDRTASFSPDGRRIVYQSDLKGQAEVFVQGYDAEKAEMAGAPVQLSNGGGKDPVWLPNGRAVDYLDPANRLVQVSLSESGLPASTRVVAEAVPGSPDVWTQAYSMAPDGRLLILRPVPHPPRPAEIQVIVNWAQEFGHL
jgi:DNA-binding winged helix-turn-helix (wHTH) protein/WD40 repeat protein